jgi:hypothetical protein
MKTIALLTFAILTCCSSSVGKMPFDDKEDCSLLLSFFATWRMVILRSCWHPTRVRFGTWAVDSFLPFCTCVPHCVPNRPYVHAWSESATLTIALGLPGSPYARTFNQSGCGSSGYYGMREVLNFLSPSRIKRIDSISIFSRKDFYYFGRNCRIWLSREVFWRVGVGEKLWWDFYAWGFVKLCRQSCERIIYLQNCHVDSVRLPSAPTRLLHALNWSHFGGSFKFISI